MASAFGAEGMVLIDHAARIHPGFRLFTIDTEFLFPETYDLMDRVEKRYGIKIEREFPKLNPAEQEAAHGAALWSHNPDLCCNIRKVEPQKRKLAGLRAWIASIRRDQTSTRAKAKRVEMDPKADIVKINPLVDWTSAQVWDYIRKHDVPTTPCTTEITLASAAPTAPAQCFREKIHAPDAGRISAKTECGLHLPDAPAPLVQLPKPIKYGDI